MAAAFCTCSVEELPSSTTTAMPARSAVPVVQKKQTLGALFSTSKSAMVDSTSSIARPFVPPKPHSSLSVESGAANSMQDDRSSGSKPASWKRRFGATQGSVPLDSKASKEELFVSVFPSVARSALSESDVSKLYGFIRQLHEGRDVDDAIRSMCELLLAPECRDLVNLIPHVLNEAISERFVKTATSLGLALDLSLAAVSRDGVDGESAAGAGGSGIRSASMSTFFERIQQKRKRKLQDTHMPTAAVVEDPQCIVCFEIPRKAYAAQCGHICCMDCWKGVRLRS